MSKPAKVAYVFPGQGSQQVGMGRDLYENFELARAVFKEADETLGFPLSQLCFEGPEDKLRLTINAQPAIVAVSFACLKVALEVASKGITPPPAFVAGHSLGEYTALAAAGVIDFPTTVYLARERGRLMHEAAGLCQPGGMVAIMGLDEVTLKEVCDEAGVWISNFNCPGQLVISGTKENLTKAKELAKARGAYRTVPLQISGPFHTSLVQPAAEGLAKVVADIHFNEPTIPIISNTTAQPMTSAKVIKEELLRQLCNGIQWQRSVEYMIAKGIMRFVEIGPGKVLTGLIRRINKGVKTLNIGDVQAIRNLIQMNGASC